MKTHRCWTLVLACCVLGTGLPAADPAPPDGWVALFNGSDLGGWKGQLGTPKDLAAMSPGARAAARASADEPRNARGTVQDGVGTVLYFENACVRELPLPGADDGR